MLKEWFYYFFQCTECRRCSVFCPYGIDTAEITMMGRELLNLVGLNINWAIEPVANCLDRKPPGYSPHGFKDMLEFSVDEIEDITGIRLTSRSTKRAPTYSLSFPRATILPTPVPLPDGLPDALP